MDIISRGADGYFHPKTEEELRALILHAGASSKKLRVRGASHSVSASIYTDGFVAKGLRRAGTSTSCSTATAGS
jgi:FAD/FMN-containing dehydrogenase